VVEGEDAETRLDKLRVYLNSQKLVIRAITARNVLHFAGHRARRVSR
jgi:hypothetical protein